MNLDDYIKSLKSELSFQRKVIWGLIVSNACWIILYLSTFKN